jgi:hypothetical protein
MDKGRRKKKREHDFAVTAYRVVQEATEQLQPESEQSKPQEKVEGKNPHAVALGKLGGKKGGPARALVSSLQSDAKR